MSDLDALLHRPEQEGFWARLWRSPARALARYIQSHYIAVEPAVDARRSLNVVCISDTHNTKPNLPDGDILIHAGDLTQSGTRRELEEQINWLDSQPHRYKLLIAGNHELCLDSQFSRSTLRKEGTPDEHKHHHDQDPMDWKSLIYLNNTSATLTFGNGRELKVFGSPYTPKHGNWAFQYPRTNTTIWDEIGIPEGLNILITHGPPKAHLDIDCLGCSLLRKALWEKKCRPLLHVFGHIHGGYGKEVVSWDSFQREYETVMESSSAFSRWLGLGRLVYHAMIGMIPGRGDEKNQTIMVNAAAVGGVRDEKRRGAICVNI
ncbi:Metallo-dependent phosphatase-like protein [Aspergillus granulosus]|uniref:Metallo-dependent phosphatase-like protein n=1 Tax=Aspergillus granulosus TaxID=176169 RepID=A0ABR4HR09_9EURO